MALLEYMSCKLIFHLFIRSQLRYCLAHKTPNSGAEVNRIAKEEAEKVNMADSLIFQTEKQLTEYGDKLPADKKTIIENGLKDLKEAHAAKDLARIDSAMNALNAAWQEASQDLYNTTQGAGEPAADAGNPNPSGDSNTQDATYEEVK